MNARSNDIRSTPVGAGAGNGRAHAYPPAADTPVAPFAREADATSVGSLLRQLTHDVPELVVKELALARAEMTESLRETKAGMASMVGGGAVLLSGLVVLLMSAVYALSNIVAPWAAALIVGAAVVAIGLGLVMAGKKRLQPGAIRPDRAMHQAHKDRMAVQSGISSGRTA